MKDFKKLNKSLKFSLQICSLFLVFFSGYAVKSFFLHSRPARTAYAVREENNHYKLIDPLLACETSNRKNFLQFKPLEKKLNDLIVQKEKDDLASNIGVYFQDFGSGKWTGVNEDAKFSPASLLKVPVMMANLAAAESNPALLSQKILYDGSFDDNAKENIQPLKQIQKGSSYSIEELLNFMITHSDNNATRLLFDSPDQTSLKEVFTDLGTPFPNPGELGDYMSPKSYALFYRVLYSATYLNRPMSEKALELLSINDRDFPQGLAAGVPENVTVAQKFGERSFEGFDSPYNKELHDCGIVYNPKHAYVLCIMTKGKDFQELTNAIRDVSKMVYEEVDADYK